MLSILHVCTDFWPSIGGIQQFVRELATRSATVDLRSTVLCFNRVKGITAKLPATDILDGVVVHRVPFLNLKYYKPVAIPLSLIRAHDLVHVHGIGAPLDYIAITKGIHRRPVVVSTHGGIFHTSTLARFKQVYFRTVVRWALRRADFVAADSASDASLFAKVSQRVQLLENAIDVGPLLALPVDRKRPGSFLYVGRLSDNKGIPLLLNATAMALKRGASLNLRIVGPDVEGKRSEYEALARRLDVAGQVDFIGEVDKRGLLQEFALAETFVSASQFEGFGLSAVEAKAAGCRLLLHRNDAFESLFGASPTAILVDFRDSNAAGAAMIEIMRQRVVDAKQHSVRRETEAYSWEGKLSEWAAVYRRVCSVDSRR